MVGQFYLFTGVVILAVKKKDGTEEARVVIPLSTNPVMWNLQDGEGGKNVINAITLARRDVASKLTIAFDTPAAKDHAMERLGDQVRRTYLSCMLLCAINDFFFLKAFE